MRHWWKLLGAVLVVGASITALRVPLAPALVHSSADRLAPGEQAFRITGYNTHFDQSVRPYVWLATDDAKFCATTVQVEGTGSLSATFDIPNGLGGQLAHLVVFSPTGGVLPLYDAVWTGDGGTPLPDRNCDVTPLAMKPFDFSFPNRSLLYETIRNLNFHVPMWFTMMLLQLVAVVYSVRTLRSNSLRDDDAALQAVNVSLLFAALGLITGSIWARATWGAWWTNDTKLNGAAVTTLIYLAYLVLRGSVPEPSKRARLAAIYNIFAFVLMLVFVMVLPRLTDSLHPGNGGNPAFSQYDLDDQLRLVFYPAVLGWMLVGTWAFTLKLRLSRLEHALDENDR